MDLYYIPQFVSTIVFAASFYTLIYFFGETLIAPIIATILSLIAYFMTSDFLSNRDR